MKHTGGCCPPACVATSCPPESLVVVAPCRGVISEYIADVEALLCIFHISDVGVGVMWCGRGCSLGCGGCVRVPTSSVVVVLPEYKISVKKK